MPRYEFRCRACGDTFLVNRPMSASGDPADVKKALPAAVNDAFGVLKGGDVAALKSYVQAHSDGKSYASYVAGWRVEITGSASDDYAQQRINISYETFFV